MRKRLQVVVDETELSRFQRAAQNAGLTLSEWVRRTLRDGESKGGGKTHEQILEALRRAREFVEQTGGAPAPPIEQMLAEIEMGYEQELE